jgi:hypothetical protein
VRGGATVLDGSARRRSARHERSAGRPMKLTSATLGTALGCGLSLVQTGGCGGKGGGHGERGARGSRAAVLEGPWL